MKGIYRIMVHLGLKLKGILIGILCLVFLSLTISPVQAKKRSSGLAITLLISGVGFQVGSTFLNTSAENKYEEYLAATTQADIQSLKDETVARENATIIMSRVGYGCIGLAVLLSIVNQFHNATVDTASTTDNLGNVSLYEEFPLNISSPPQIKYNQVYGRTQLFSILPNYDFQTQRASLQFLYRF